MSFRVREGDDVHYLGYLIGKSHRLESLDLWHMPLDDSFRDGLAVNKSIQELHICSDLGEEGYRCLAPFFRNTNTLEEIHFDANFISTESMKSFASLLSQSQIPSLKGIYFEDFVLSDNEYTEIAQALSRQPQLEVLVLAILDEENNDSFLGHITLGATMKNWKSPCLKVLGIDWCVGDDDMLALVEGMANCSNLERLNLGGNAITEIGLRALSSLFQSKDFLRSVVLRSMNISDDGMTVLAPGLASLRLLNRLDLSSNRIGDVGLEALAFGLVGLRHLESLLLSNNEGFSAVGLKSLSRALQTMSRLEYLNLSSNSIDDKGLHAFVTAEMKDQCTIDSLDLRNNAISSGVRSLGGMSSLRMLELKGNNIGDNDEAMEALVEAMESLCNLEYLELTKVTSSGLSILSPIFQHEKSCLRKLHLWRTKIDDSGAVALANGLKGNKSLTEVCFDHRSLTDVGWSAFERLLCDTSSVSNTYYSNRTLEEIGYSYYRLPPSIKALLELNKQKDEGVNVNVPISKILMSHSDIDMTPLLQYKLKLLPFVFTWFERARSSRLSQSRIALEGRKLSALYQFVSGASYSVVEGYAHSKNNVVSSSTPRKRKIHQRDEE